MGSSRVLAGRSAGSKPGNPTPKWVTSEREVVTDLYESGRGSWGA